jgi:hypothetical protein
MRQSFFPQNTRIIAALLVLLATANVQAQEITDGEAFYIYRNDGDFNGFFFDEVEEMRYSKLDLDSLLHDEYVVQEVVTADSIYRIPLAAIDSVGFVQPEIILNPRLKNLDELGITSYVSMYDARYGTIWLYNSIPEDLLPVVGDVLVSFDGQTYNPSNYEGYSGIGRKVTAVEYITSTMYPQYKISTDPIEKMSDVFVQFISVEEVGTDESGNAKRRLAGYHSLPRKDASGGFTKTLVDVSLSPHLTFYPTEGSSISLDLNLGVKLTLGMVYRVRGDDFFIRASLGEDLSASAGVTLKVNTNGEEAIPVLPDGVTSIKFPAFCPLFEIKPMPKGFFRYGGEIYAKATLPEMSTGLRQSFVINSDDPYLLSFNFNERKKQPSDPDELIDVGDLNIGWNGFVQCGTKSNLGISTNSWFSTVFSAYLGVDVYMGPKLEGNVNISAAALANGDGAYSLRDSHLSFSPYSIDFEAKGMLSSLWGWDPVDRTLFDGNLSLEPMSMWMFPTFTDFSATLSESNESLSAEVHTDERRVFWGSQMGIGLFNEYEDVDNPRLEYHPTRLIPLLKAPESFRWGFGIEKPGYYKVMPVLKTLNFLIPVKSMQKEFIIPPYLKISPTVIHHPWQGGTSEIACTTNGTMIDALSHEVSGNTVIIKAGENDEFWPIKGSGVIWSTYNIENNGTVLSLRSPTATYTIEQDAAPASIYKYLDVLINVGYDLFPGRIPCSVSSSENTLSVSANGSETQETETGATRTITYNVNYQVDITRRDSCVITGGHGYCKWLTTGTDEGKPYTYTHSIEFTITKGDPCVGGKNNTVSAITCHYVDEGSGGSLTQPYHHERDETCSLTLWLHRTENEKE